MTEEKLLTILPPEMRGVMFTSGYRGIGKSFLISQADLPQNIAFLDFESKGEGINNQLEFGYYRALNQEADGDPQKLYNVTMQTIDEIKQNQFTTVIFDNVSPFELAMNAEAANDAEMYTKRFGLNLKNVKAGRFGGTKSIVNFMISDLCSKLHAKGVQLIICTSHISPRWGAAGPIPNKYNIKGANKWQELSILTLILIPGTNPPIPGALIQKEQLGTISIPTDISMQDLDAMRRGEMGHTIQRRLPPKIGECTFENIRWYLYNPANFKDLEGHERPTFEEADPFDQRLNKEQFAYMQLALQKQEREEQEEKEIIKTYASIELDNQISTVIEEHGVQPLPKLRGLLNDKGHTYSMPEVAKALKQYKESNSDN